MSSNRLGGLIRPEAHFRWRAHEVTRMESFSDAVFAFSVTLLVVSLEVPRNSRELLDVMRGFPAFGVCFAILAYFWYQHVVYFRRFGLQSAYVAALNCALLFCVLFYVYPLKFLFSEVVLVSREGAAGAVLSAGDARALFVIYGLGYAAVSLVFLLLYRHAFGQRAVLQLDAFEVFATRRGLVDFAALIAIGFSSASLALALVLPAGLLGLAGVFYMMIPVYFTVAGFVFGARFRRLLADRPPGDVLPPG